MNDPIEYLRSIAHDDTLAHTALRHLEAGHMTRDDVVTAVLRIQQQALRESRAAHEQALMVQTFALTVPTCQRCGEPVIAGLPVTTYTPRDT